MSDKHVVSIHRMNEVCLGLLAVFWGVVLMLPGDLFERIEVYQLLRNFAPDTVWGVVMIVCGIVTLARMPRRAHKHAHWILCTVWLGMAVLLLSTTTRPTSLLFASLFLVIAIIHASKYMRLAQSLMLYPSGQPK